MSVGQQDKGKAIAKGITQKQPQPQAHFPTFSQGQKEKYYIVNTTPPRKAGNDMTKYEFEQLSIRNNAGTITLPLYETIERLYMSETEYHQTHGGINETKQEFVKRVFGGKVNTPKTILKKTITEIISENTYCLQGTNNTKADYDNMNARIEEHCIWLASQKYI